MQISFRKSLQETWKIWTEHFLKFLTITTIVIFCIYLFSTAGVGALFYEFQKIGKDALSWHSGVTYFLLLSLVAVIFVQLWGFLSLLVLVAKRGEISAHDAITGAKNFFFDFLVLLFLQILLYSLAALVGYIFVAIIGGVVGLIGGVNFLNNYYAWLGIFPIISTTVMAFYLMFSPFCLIDKKLFPWQALKASFSMVQGNFWRIVWRVTLASAIIIIAAIILSYTPYIGYALAGIIVIPTLFIYAHVLYEKLKNGASN